MDGDALQFPRVADEGQGAFSAQLERASALLRAEQLPEAEMQLLEAMQQRPDDTRARNLLGLVYFRAGRHDAAQQVYSSLVAEEPEDPALRLNLGLVELKMGKHAEAAANLRRVVLREPANQKAQGYYGLALMRSGELVAARAAFLAAGQADLARQVAEKIAAASASPAPSDAEAPGLFEPSPPDVAAIEVPDVAEVSIDAFVEIGKPAPVAFAGPTLGARTALSLATFVASRELPTPAIDDTFSLAEAGVLVIRVETRVPTRIAGALASSGRINYVPLARRVRGSHTAEPFGDGDDAMCLATGTGVMVISPRGGNFHLLALKDEVIYLREAAVFAFEETLSWENGRIPGSGGVPMVQFRGDGRVVMRTDKAPYTVRLTTGEVLYADQDALLGWTGQVVTQQLRGMDGEATAFVSCNGEGALILIDPSQTSPTKT